MIADRIACPRISGTGEFFSIFEFMLSADIFLKCELEGRLKAGVLCLPCEQFARYKGNTFEALPEAGYASSKLNYFPL
jgi:hypothetical protein